MFSVAQYTVEESQSAHQLLFSSLFCCFCYHKSNTHQPLFGALKAIKVRLYPTPEQADFLNQQFGAVRKVYNLGLAIMQNRYRHQQQSLKPEKDLKPLLVIAKHSRKYYWLGQYDHDRLLSIALKVARVHAEKRFEAVKDAILTLNKINLVGIQAS